MRAVISTKWCCTVHSALLLSPSEHVMSAVTAWFLVHSHETTQHGKLSIHWERPSFADEPWAAQKNRLMMHRCMASIMLDVIKWHVTKVTPIGSNLVSYMTINLNNYGESFERCIYTWSFSRVRNSVTPQFFTSIFHWNKSNRRASTSHRQNVCLCCTAALMPLLTSKLFGVSVIFHF